MNFRTMFISAKTNLQREMVSDSLAYVDKCEEKLSIVAAGEHVEVNRNLFLIFCPLLRHIVDDLQTKIIIIPSVKVSSLLLLQDLLLGLGHPSRIVTMTENELLMDSAYILGLDLRSRLESIPATKVDNDISGGGDRFFLENEVIEEYSNTYTGNMKKSPLDYKDSLKCLQTQSTCSTKVLEHAAITEQINLSTDNEKDKVSDPSTIADEALVRHETSVKHMGNPLFNPCGSVIVSSSEKNSDKPNQINIISNINCSVDITDDKSLFVEGHVSKTKSPCQNISVESPDINIDPIKENNILNKTGVGNFLRLKPIEQLTKTDVYTTDRSRFPLDRNTAMDEISQKEIDHFIKDCRNAYVEKDVLLSVPKKSTKLNSNGEQIPRKSYRLHCMNCNFSTDNSDHIKIHVRANHVSEYIFKCNQCPISSPLYSTLTKQKSLYSTLTKRKCLKQVSNNESMSMGNKPAMTCLQCNFQSSVLRDMRDHTEHSHGVAFFQTCPTCPYTSKRPGKYLQHVSSCGNKPIFKCQYCDFTKHKLRLVNRHVKKQHKDRIEGLFG